jgi:hypothetical protein
VRGGELGKNGYLRTATENGWPVWVLHSCCYSGVLDTILRFGISDRDSLRASLIELLERDDFDYDISCTTTTIKHIWRKLAHAQKVSETDLILYYKAISNGWPIK